MTDEVYLEMLELYLMDKPWGTANCYDEMSWLQQQVFQSIKKYKKREKYANSKTKSEIG